MQFTTGNEDPACLVIVGLIVWAAAKRSRSAGHSAGMAHYISFSGEWLETGRARHMARHRHHNTMGRSYLMSRAPIAAHGLIADPHPICLTPLPEREFTTPSTFFLSRPVRRQCTFFRLFFNPASQSLNILSRYGFDICLIFSSPSGFSL